MFETWGARLAKLADIGRERTCHLRCANPPTSHRARGTNHQRSPESEHALKVAGGSETATPNGPKLTGLAPHGLKFSTREPAACGDKSGAAQS